MDVIFLVRPTHHGGILQASPRMGTRWETNWLLLGSGGRYLVWWKTRKVWQCSRRELPLAGLVVVNACLDKRRPSRASSFILVARFVVGIPVAVLVLFL